MAWGDYFHTIWEFLKENTIPLQGTLAILAIVSFAAYRMRRLFGLARNKIKRRQAASPTDTLPSPANVADENVAEVSAAQADAERSGMKKGSIAVLPFTNLSSDPEQEYFSDGISEDIITDLSKLPELLVAGRNSSFVYKGKSVDLRQVGRELGVRYLLEGSVRKAGNRVRITAQLIDAVTGNHLWAKRFDKTLADVFAIQDEITEEIVIALDTKMVGWSQGHWRAFLKTREARELYRGANSFFGRPSKEANILAIPIFEQVKNLEPDSVVGYQAVGYSHWYDARYGWGKDPARSLELAAELARQALEKDDTYPGAIGLMANVHLLQGDYKKAIATAQRAEALEPTHSHVLAWLADILTLSGNPKEGVAKANKAIGLYPSPPIWYVAVLAKSYYGCGRFEDAIGAAEAIVPQDREEWEGRLFKTAAHAALEQMQEAKKEARTILKADSEFSLAAFAETQPYRDHGVLDKLLELLRKAGLPE